MPRPYSTDLRERVLTAYEAGEGSQAEVAGRYRIGERTLSGRLKAAHEEGRRARGQKPRASYGKWTEPLRKGHGKTQRFRHSSISLRP